MTPAPGTAAPARSSATPPPVVGIDPLFDDGPEAMVDLARRFGSYHTYARHERIDLDIGRGLHQRHDSIQYFLRTGGLRGAAEAPDVLTARTAYFREEYAYGDTEHIDGIGPFLHSERLAEAARQIHGRPVVQPAIAYANLMVPGQELAVHTDVPEFRGLNRKGVPQWLLVVMHHSGLFDAWRLHIATGIAWFHDSDLGALAYWPDGPDEPVRHHRIRANTALVLDTDSVFHGVDRVTDEAATVVPAVELGSTLQPADPADAKASGVDADLGDDTDHHASDDTDAHAGSDTDSDAGTGTRREPGGRRGIDGGRWVLRAPDGGVAASYDWDELRFSVSWKAYCFADEAERAAWRDHSGDLELDDVVDRLVDDLVERGITSPDVPRDPDLGLLLIDTYVGFPTT